MKRMDRATATLYSAVLSTTDANGGTLCLGEPVKDHTVQAAWTSGGAGTTVSTLALTLQGSLDGTTWFSLADHTVTADEITAKAFMFHVVDKPVTYVRSALTSATFSSTTNRGTITVQHLGHSW